MLMVNTLQVIVYTADTAASDVCVLLAQAGHGVGCHSLHTEVGLEPAQANLIVVDGSQHLPQALHLCRHLRQRLTETFVPIVLITEEASPAGRLAGLESGADIYLLRPFEPAELLAQVQTFARIKDRHDRLTEKTAEVHRINKRLQSAYQQIDQELQLAGRIQASFLPQALPALPQVRFAVHYQPCGRIGGDFYDVFRLDEKHFGFYVADAMGHGIPASLLTIFVKKGIRAKEISGHDYRLVPPGEVLQRLNRDLIDQALSDNPFITMVYGLLNYTAGTLHFARSGHPYPLYLPHDADPEFWQIEGTLMGVFDTAYPIRTQQLRPGDKLLLYTDGMDAAQFRNGSRGTSSLRDCAHEHRQLPITDLVHAVASQLFIDQTQKDDLTLLGVEMVDDGASR